MKFFQKADGLGKRNVQAIAEDREGACGSARATASASFTREIPIVPRPEDPASKDALSVAAASSGGVWHWQQRGSRVFDPGTKNLRERNPAVPKLYPTCV